MFRRILLMAVVLFGVATGIMMTFGDRLAGAVARRALARATQLVAARGIELRDVHFDRAFFAGIGAIRFDQIVCTVRLPQPDARSALRSSVKFSAANVVVDAGWPWSEEASLAVSDGQIHVLGELGAPTGDQLTRVRIRVSFPFSWWHPTEAVGVLEAEARSLVNEGRTRLVLELNSAANFLVAHRRQELSVRTEPLAGGGARLALERAEIERLSREYTNPLTATEIDLVALFPHRAPALLRACEQASRAAVAQRHRDRSFPHDAFRHVYWSWLLTKEFGPTFSEQVTDAHEIGATYEVGVAGRRMDMQNNAVGRAYALAGVDESELVDRVLTDPNVVRRLPAAATR